MKKKKIYSTTGNRQCSAGLITTDIQLHICICWNAAQQWSRQWCGGLLLHSKKVWAELFLWGFCSVLPLSRWVLWFSSKVMVIFN